MANVKISQLPTATTLTTADLIPIVQGGVTKQVTPDLLPVSTATAAALAGKDAAGAATAAQAAAIAAAATAAASASKSADTITDGTTNKAYTAAEKTKLAGVASAATANRADSAVDTLLAAKADLVGGLVPTSQIPAIALTNAVTVASQAAMLALTTTQVQPGDVAVRTDGAGTFILTATDPTVLANWVRLNAPTDVVTTVNGQQGTVVLAKTDVGLGNVDNTSDAAKPVSTAQAAANALRAIAMTATAIKTAAYTAGPNEIIPVDATSAAVPVTLPTAPADKTRATIKKLDTTTNLVTVVSSGSDLFNKPGGTGTLTLTLPNQSVTVQYATSVGLWYVVTGDLPLSQLDVRFAPKPTVSIDLCQTPYNATPGTDISTVLQTAINWLAANAPGGGEIFFSNPGSRATPYLINGAQQAGTWTSPTVTTTLTSTATLPQATIAVASTTGFTNPGGQTAQAMVGGQLVTYTGISGNTLTGCTGGTGTIASGAAAAQAFTYSGQILFPGVSFSGQPNIPIRIRGLTHTSGGISATGSGNGGVVFSTNTTSGYVFACVPAQSQWNYQWTAVKPVFEDVVITAPNNPACGVIDARTALRFKWRGTIDTQTAWSSVTGSNAAGSQRIALSLPWGYNNGDIEVSGEIHGFPIAVNLSEHAWFPNLDISNCGVAFQKTSSTGGHNNILGYVDLEEVGVLFENAALGTLALVGQVDTENVTPPSNFPVTMAYRLSNGGGLSGAVGFYSTESSYGSFGGAVIDGASSQVGISFTNLNAGAAPSSALHPVDSFQRINGTALGAGQGAGLTWPTAHAWRNQGTSYPLVLASGGGMMSSSGTSQEVLVRARGPLGEPRAIAATFVLGATYNVGIRAQRIFNTGSAALYLQLNGGNLKLGLGFFGAGTTLATATGVVTGSSTVVATLEVYYLAGLPYQVRALLNGVVQCVATLTSGQQATLTPAAASPFLVEDGISFADGTTKVTYFEVTPINSLVTSVNGQIGDVTVSGGSASPATATTPGTVQLAPGQTSTVLATVATTGAYADLTGKPAGAAATGAMLTGHCFTADPTSIAVGVAAWPTANRQLFMRLKGGNAAPTKFRIYVGTASGNIGLAVYSNTGTGPTAAPSGAPKFTTGSIACPAAGIQTITIASPVAVNDGDWVGFWCDNVTATFDKFSGAPDATMTAGLIAAQSSVTGGPTALPSATFGATQCYYVAIE